MAQESEASQGDSTRSPLLILDTNQLKAEEPLDRPSISLLSVLKRQRGYRLALPSIVLEEYMAKYRHHVHTLSDDVQGKIDKLRNIDRGGRPEATLSPPEVVTAQHRSWAELLFEVLPSPPGAAEEALIREANRRAPASASWDKSGSGARDVLVWLTVINAVESGEDVVFISADGDFSRDGRLHLPLESEAAEAQHSEGGRFQFFHSIERFFEHLAEAHSGTAMNNELLLGSQCKDAVADTLVSGAMFVDFVGSLPFLGGQNAWGAGGVEVNSAELLTQPRSLSLDGITWVSTRALWVGTRIVQPMSQTGVGQPLEIEWRLRGALLATVGRNGELVTVEIASHARVEVIGAHPISV